MENILPPVNRTTAEEALAEIDDATRAVRDTPWPVGLYVANAFLLGAMGLTQLFDSYRLGAWIVVGLVAFAFNMLVGHRMGTPLALPTSKGFLTAVAVSGVCLGAAFIVANYTDHDWLIVALSAGSMMSYLAGSMAHYRSTRR